jgi:hypothetical protein
MTRASKEKEALLTQEMLKELLHYDPETGLFTWRTSGSGRKTCRVAGTIRTDGYCNIGIGGRSYLLHRLAYLYMTGKWPKHYIDHINGVKGDNRWVNLRGATSEQNMRNRSGYKNSSSNYKGVSWKKGRGFWEVYRKINYKRKHLGYCSCEHEAALVYNQEVEKLHGDFACFNQVYNKFDVEVGPDD